MALRSSGALFSCAVLLALGCSSTPTTDPSAPAPAAPAAEAPAAEAPASAENPAAEAPASADEPKPASGGDEKWEGEEDAVGKPVARTKEETRTTEVIQQTIVAQRQPIRDCYDRGRKELPDLKGTMTIKLVLDPDGKVKTAELNVERSDIKAPAVVNCAIDAIKKIKFPPSSRGMDTMVNYPFDFKPDGGGGGGSKKKP